MYTVEGFTKYDSTPMRIDISSSEHGAISAARQRIRETKWSNVRVRDPNGNVIYTDFNPDAR